MPGDIARHFVDVVFLLIRPFGEFDQEPCGIARVQICFVQRHWVSLGLHAPADMSHTGHSQCDQLSDQ